MKISKHFSLFLSVVILILSALLLSSCQKSLYGTWYQCYEDGTINKNAGFTFDNNGKVSIIANGERTDAGTYKITGDKIIISINYSDLSIELTYAETFYNTIIMFGDSFFVRAD